MFKCKVCGNEFEATKENHYIARDKGLFCEGDLYDAYDCPKCGSQIIAKERKRSCGDKNAHKAQNAQL